MLESEALRGENRRFGGEAAVATPDDLAELTRLRAQRDAAVKKVTARQNATRKGGILRVGNAEITHDSPPVEKLEVMYREGRSSPMRAWQTLLSLGSALTIPNYSNHDWVDYDMMALMFCVDSAGRAKLESFLGQLPPDARAAIGSAERLIAPVFDAWLWKGDRPRGYGGGDQGDTYIDGDPTRAVTHWEVTRASGRKQVEQFPFKRFDDGWRYGPLGSDDVEQMLALLDPNTGQPKVSTEVIR